jgi:hypothetical protein
MSQTDFQELENSILQRLAAVDPGSCTINASVVGDALDSYLEVLGLSRRPVRWAKDAEDARKLTAEADLASVQENIERTTKQVFGDALDRVPMVWTYARDKAREAGHHRQLEVAKELVCGYSVLFSVPWSKYQLRDTGDRGRRSHPLAELPWRAVADALECAARAYAECVWAHHEQNQDPESRTFEREWLLMLDAFEAGLWCFWIGASEIIALPRPILRIESGRLHSTDGPAITWPDSEQQYFFLNDVNVPKEIVTTPARALNPRLILRERNGEVRREIVRKIGIERICQELNAECLDRVGDYELLLLDLQDGRTRPFLKMKNPSIGVYHIEGVAPECRTVAEALAWRNQSDVPPSVLT